MSYFKAKMHPILFWLGLCPRPHWGSLQHSPEPLAGFKGPTSKGRGGRMERKGKGRRNGKRGEKGREIRRGEGLCPRCWGMDAQDGRDVFLYFYFFFLFHCLHNCTLQIDSYLLTYLPTYFLAEICAHSILPGNKHNWFETSMQCAEWSQFIFRHFLEVWPKIKKYLETFKISGRHPTCRLCTSCQAAMLCAICLAVVYQVNKPSMQTQCLLIRNCKVYFTSSCLCDLWHQSANYCLLTVVRWSLFVGWHATELLLNNFAFLLVTFVVLLQCELWERMPAVMWWLRGKPTEPQNWSDHLWHVGCRQTRVGKVTRITGKLS